MVHIQDLPNEILSHILDFIVYPTDDAPLKPPDAKILGREDDDDDDDDWEDDDGYDDDYDNVLENYDDEVKNLRDICLVSRRFRELAQPLLFRHLDIDGFDGDLEKIVSFARAIYRRPELGKNVEDIALRAPVSFGPFKTKAISTEDSELFKGELQALGLGDEEKAWIKGIEASDLGVFGALLVNKTPNLMALNLPGSQFDMKPFIHLFSQNASFLAKLETLWVEGYPEFAGYDIASYKEFLALPDLISVTFQYGDLVNASFPSAWAPGTLSAEELAFNHCHIDAGAIQKFMRACKKPKSFVYKNFTMDRYEARPPSTRAGAELNAAQAQKAALLHKDTLENFHLEFARSPSDIENVEQYISSRVKVGSFREFSVLETIAIAHALLPPKPQFPRSLKQLHITDCNSSIRDMVKHIAKDCTKGLYPDLTTFNVLALDITRPIKLPGQRIPPGQTPQQCFLSLQNLFKGTKVHFQILPYKLSDLEDYLDLGDEEDYEDDYEDYYDNEYPIPGLGGLGRGGLERGPMPPALLEMIMQRALQDPDFAHLRALQDPGLAHLRHTRDSPPRRLPWEIPSDDEMDD